MSVLQQGAYNALYSLPLRKFDMVKDMHGSLFKKTTSCLILDIILAIQSLRCYLRCGCC